MFTRNIRWALHGTQGRDASPRRPPVLNHAEGRTVWGTVPTVTPRRANPCILRASVLAGVILALAAGTAGATVTDDVAFTAAYDGSEQRYVRVLPDGFDPAQPHDVLVCLHGHGSDRWQFVTGNFAEANAARDIARQNAMIFISPDYRATTSWMGPAAEADMLQIIAALKTQYQVKRMIVSGGSMGASSSLTFAALHPELVDGVVSLNGLANHETYTNFQDAIAASFGGTKAQVPDEYHKRSAVFFPERFTMPLAVTAGGQDTVVPPESVMQLAQAAQAYNTHVRIDYVASRGHSTDYNASLAAYQFVVLGGVTGTGTSANVIAYWDFSSDSNGVTDVSGNFHNLTNSGVVISNGAAIFDGTQASFRSAGALDLRGNAGLTVEFFIRTPVTDRVMMVLEQSENAGANNGAFFFDANDIGLAGAVCNTYQCAGDWNVQNTAAGALSDGGWHHMAMVFDPSKAAGQRKTFYFDGIAQGTFAGYGGDTFSDFANAVLYIGSRADESLKFTGELDDVRISGAALATDQFLQTRTVGSRTAIAYWRFDEGAGLADSSGNNNVLAGSGVLFTNGVARFDGVDPAFALNTVGTLDLTACANLTVEFFMRTDSHASGIVALEQTAPFYSNPGAFIVDVNDGADGPGRIVGGFCTSLGLNLDMTPVNAADDGQWHHVAIVYDGAQAGNGLSSLYFDGTLASATFNGLAEGTPTPFLNATLFIGSRGNTGSRYAGELDDVRITGAALAPGQFLKAPSTELPRVIAYWPFSRRQPLADASGNGRALSGTGVTFKDDAAVLDGNQTAFGTLPRTLNLRPYPALTVECFMRTTSAGAGVVLEHTPNFTVSRGGFIQLVNEVAAGQFDGGFSMPGSAYNIDSTAAGAVADGQWHHVALVYDPAGSGDDRVRVFLDRVQQGKRDAGWNSDADLAFLNAALFIGSRNNSDIKFAGELDDVKITGAALAPAAFMKSRTGPIGSVMLVL